MRFNTTQDISSMTTSEALAEGCQYGRVYSNVEYETEIDYNKGPDLPDESSFGPSEDYISIPNFGIVECSYEKHVGQPTEEKENSWTDIEHYSSEFSPYQMPQLCPFEIIYPDNQVMCSDNEDSTIFVNTIDAKRPQQRNLRFGFNFTDAYVETVKHITHEPFQLGVFLSLPGYHGEIVSCSNHSAKFKNQNFFKLFCLNDEVVKKICVDQLPGKPMYVMQLPYDKRGDPYAMLIEFHCFSSCLNKKGDSKNGLKLNFVLLNSAQQVIKHIAQKIRVTANPNRDALATGVGRKKCTSKRKSREQSPFTTSPKIIKREPDLSTNNVNSYYSETADDVVESVVGCVPHDCKEETRKLLLRMKSQERLAVIKTEQRRFFNNIVMATKEG